MEHTPDFLTPSRTTPTAWFRVVGLGLGVFFLVSLGLSWLLERTGPLGYGVAASAFSIIAGMCASERLMVRLLDTGIRPRDLPSVEALVLLLVVLCRI
jgi:hypothetical protein